MLRRELSLFENEQRIVLRLLLNYRQGRQIPVDQETRLLLLAGSCELHFRHLPCVYGLAANCEPPLRIRGSFFEPVPENSKAMEYS